jgi:hypothetical protein
MSQQERVKAIMARFSTTEAAAIDRWRREQDEIPSIATAVRTLVRRGLEVERRPETAEEAAA